MEKKELLNIIDEKFNSIEKIKQEISDLEKEYAHKYTSFKAGDFVASTVTDNTVFSCTGDFDYSVSNDLIYVNCTVVTTSNQIILKDNIYSIPEKYLTLIKNGEEEIK
jgi:hypothetical protein